MTEDQKPPKKRKRRKKRLQPDMPSYRRLATTASEKLISGATLTEEELIGIFKTDNLNEDEFEQLISLAVDQNSASRLLTDYQYIVKPINAKTYLNIWCKDVEAEMFAYFERNPERLYSLEPRKFEEFVAAIFKNHGFSVKLTPETRDGGADIIAVERSSLTGESIHLIECKRYAPNRNVGIGVVQRLLGTVTQLRATKGIIVTTSFFTKDARAVAQDTKHTLTLRDYNNILEWLKVLKH